MDQQRATAAETALRPEWVRRHEVVVPTNDTEAYYEREAATVPWKECKKLSKLFTIPQVDSLANLAILTQPKTMMVSERLLCLSRSCLRFNRGILPVRPM